MKNIIRFQINNANIEISNDIDILQNFSIKKSMVELISSFDFTINSITDKNGFYKQIIKPDDKIDIFFNDTLLLSGLAEQQSSTIFPLVEKWSGRTITGKIIDTNARVFQYKERNFKKLIENILTDNGFAGIRVINQVLDIKDLTNEVENDIDKNDTIFNAIDRLAAALGVLLITDNKGNIVITREGVAKINTPLVFNGIAVNDNNFYDVELSTDTTRRVRFVEINSQSAENVDALAVYEDKTVRYPTRKSFTYKMGINNTTYDIVAEWKAKRLKAESEYITGTVQGFYADDKQKILWDVNKRVEIKCDIRKWNKIMMISEVEYTASSQSGFATKLTLVPIGAFGFPSDIKAIQDTSFGFTEEYQKWSLPPMNENNNIDANQFVIDFLNNAKRETKQTTPTQSNLSVIQNQIDIWKAQSN